MTSHSSSCLFVRSQIVTEPTVFVREKEIERKRQRERDREKDREHGCVWKRERERAIETSRNSELKFSLAFTNFPI